MASYKVYRSTGVAGNFNLLDTPEITATAYVDSSLSPDTDYYYKIASADEIDTGAQSEAAAASTKAPSAAPTGRNARRAQRARLVERGRRRLALPPVPRRKHRQRIRRSLQA